MFDIQSFRDYIKELIGCRTQQQFAKDAGISNEHLSRMLRQQDPSRPTRDTLRKLSEGSGPVYEKLKKLCGYDDKGISLETPEEDLQKTADELRSGLADMTKGARIYDTLEDFLEEYGMLYDTRSGVLAIGEKAEYNEGDHFRAEYVSAFSASYTRLGYEYRIFGALFYSETKAGRYVVLDAAFDGDSLIHAGLVKKEEAKEAFKGRPLVFTMKRSTAAEERLLKAIFGGPYEEVTGSAIGFGVSFKKGYITDDMVLKFAQAHKEACVGCEEVERILAGEPVQEVLAEYSTEFDMGEGPACLIAKMARAETGICFGFYEDATMADGAESAIMVEDDMYACYEKGEKEKMKRATRRLASELGIPEYGETIVYVKELLNTANRYRTEEEEEEA